MAKDRCLHHLRTLGQSCPGFGRVNLRAGAHDHIRRAASQEDVAVGVRQGDLAGIVSTILEDSLR